MDRRTTKAVFAIVIGIACAALFPSASFAERIGARERAKVRRIRRAARQRALQRAHGDDAVPDFLRLDDKSFFRYERITDTKVTDKKYRPGEARRQRRISKLAKEKLREEDELVQMRRALATRRRDATRARRVFELRRIRKKNRQEGFIIF